MLIIDERTKREKYPSGYVMAVLMPYINSSSPRSANLGTRSLCRFVRGRNPIPPPRRPLSRLGACLDRAEGEQTPGARLDVSSLPEDMNPQPMASVYTSSQQILPQICNSPGPGGDRRDAPRLAARRHRRSRAEKDARRLSGAGIQLRAPGGSRGGAVPHPASRVPHPASRIPLACLGRVSS